ncbi:unnamed protein product [Candida verbasci]|uniref:Protein YOP1 n=1 Tax=Candida verbasci TaxID=1227364 RepID=A0A9W4TWB8_9ASCO|nr:unnamed protein product [Candida verbasci]
MGFFSILSTLVFTVYPVIASCKAFEDYTRVTNKISSQNFKVGGVTIPLNLIYQQDNNLDASDEKLLQIHLISIQKWLIYWIVIAVINSIESILFLNYLPGYSILKLIGSIWLIIPMISIGKKGEEFDENKSFDNTLEWKNFTEQGSGLIFFTYIKPWIEKNLETIKKFTINPFDLIQILKLANFINKDGENNDSTESLLDSSFVMVMNMKNKFTGTSETPAEPKEVKENDFDVVDTITNEESENVPVQRKKSYYFF